MRNKRGISPLAYDFATRAACISDKEFIKLVSLANSLTRKDKHWLENDCHNMVCAARDARGYVRKKLLIMAMHLAYRVELAGGDNDHWFQKTRIMEMARGFGYISEKNNILTVHNKYASNKFKLKRVLKRFFDEPKRVMKFKV